MNAPRYPSLYQINTRVWLTELAHQLGRPATLDEIPGVELDHLAERGFDWIWLLSVRRTGTGVQRVSRSNPEWRHEFQETLPDLCEDDIAGSGFAITGYTAPTNLGGKQWLLQDQRQAGNHKWNGDDLQGRGLFLDMAPWQVSVFSLTAHA